MSPSLLHAPACRPFFNLIARLGLGILGWKIHGKMPDLKKFILVAAPHTSNWDFVIFLLIVFKFGIPVHWMGKHSMFIPLFRSLLKRLGGIPIDRTQKGNTVKTMVNAFNRSDGLIVTIAPSGTRSKVKKWRTGFYQIARKAEVPIVLGFVDYKKKIGGIGPVIMPSGSMEKDMKTIQAFYTNKSGKA